MFKILKKRHFPKYLNPFGGSNWWAFPIETIHYINTFIKTHPDYLTYHKFTHCPDEIFFHSIIFSKYKSNKIEKSVTYVNWSRKNCSLPVTFTSEDYIELSNQKEKLFARKFDKKIDTQILDKIDKELLNIAAMIY